MIDFNFYQQMYMKHLKGGGDVVEPLPDPRLERLLISGDSNVVLDIIDVQTQTKTSGSKPASGKDIATFIRDRRKYMVIANNNVNANVYDWDSNLVATFTSGVPIVGINSVYSEFFNQIVIIGVDNQDPHPYVIWDKDGNILRESTLSGGGGNPHQIEIILDPITSKEIVLIPNNTDGINKWDLETEAFLGEWVPTGSGTRSLTYDKVNDLVYTGDLSRNFQSWTREGALVEDMNWLDALIGSNRVGMDYTTGIPPLTPILTPVIQILGEDIDNVAKNGYITDAKWSVYSTPAITMLGKIYSDDNMTWDNDSNSRGEIGYIRYASSGNSAEFNMIFKELPVGISHDGILRLKFRRNSSYAGNGVRINVRDDLGNIVHTEFYAYNSTAWFEYDFIIPQAYLINDYSISVVKESGIAFRIDTIIFGVDGLIPITAKEKWNEEVNND